ncbi:hypothetical protein ACRAWB_09845 [Leifsonia poae]|uniref:hypothetical protein n=1 Tax=Leifsonia poae TaxID=110933 RepID=UPI003D68CF17
MILIGAGTVAILIGGFFLGVQPSLQAAAAADAARQAAFATNQVNQAALDALESQNKKIGELTGDLETLRLSVPSEQNMDSFIDAVDAAAAAEGLVVQNVSPADATAYAPQGASAPAPQPSATATPAPSATPTPTPAPGAAASPAGAQAPAVHTDPSISAANFLAIPVKIGVGGPLDHTIAFVHRLQTGSRLFLVSGLDGGVDGGAKSAAGGSATAAPTAPTETYSVSGYLYVLAKAAAPAAPASK